LLPQRLVEVQLLADVFLRAGIGALAHHQPGGIAKALEKKKHQYNYSREYQ